MSFIVTLCLSFNTNPVEWSEVNCPNDGILYVKGWASNYGVIVGEWSLDYDSVNDWTAKVFDRVNGRHLGYAEVYRMAA